ncbi:hypothetical protein OBV_41570 [Oscillibacter valericigenes Sjm18-20]|nr:hypothetical protein OBV_41570 [Oscillibacter valericigenes Sjm18-20]
MDYDRVILEMINRISVLEEKVATLEKNNDATESVETNELQAPSKKYRLLSDYLHDSEDNKVTLTFNDIEKMLGFELPPSAHTHRAFWANTTSHSIALSWLGVGYETVEVDMEKEIVVFEQKRQYGKEGTKVSRFISEAQFQKAYRSAGLWFVAMYTEAFLLRIDEIQDPVKKTYFIKEIYNNGNNADKDESGTRTRVNSLWRIIESGRTLQVLEIAANSDRLRNDFRDAYETANDLLNRIKTGEFIIPEI